MGYINEGMPHIPSYDYEQPKTNRNLALQWPTRVSNGKVRNNPFPSHGTSIQFVLP